MAIGATEKRRERGFFDAQLAWRFAGAGVGKNIMSEWEQAVFECELQRLITIREGLTRQNRREPGRETRRAGDRFRFSVAAGAQ